MKIKINGTEKVFENERTLDELVKKELNGKGSDGIAVAINYKVIHRQNWKETKVNENDEIEIVTAVQGG